MDKENLSDYAQQMLNNDKFGHLTGFELVDCGEDYAKLKLKLEEKHMNGRGITHGGALFTIADVASGIAMWCSGRAAVTLSANITYMKISEIGNTIYAEAKLINATYRISTYEVKVTDEDGNNLALVQTMMYKKDLK